MVDLVSSGELCNLAVANSSMLVSGSDSRCWREAGESERAESRTLAER